MRVRINPSCSSVFTRDCCSNKVSDSRVIFSSIPWILPRSLTLSARERDSCCICE